MGWAEFVAAIKGVEEFDPEFAEKNPSTVYVVVVAILKVINRITFSLMVFRLITYLETFGITMPF